MVHALLVIDFNVCNTTISILHHCQQNTYFSHQIDFEYDMTYKHWLYEK